MKHIYIIINLILAISLSAGAGDIQLKINDITAEWGGDIRIGLYQEAGFPTEGKAIQGWVLQVTDISADFTINDIPEGVYAIAIFQDINTDGKLNRTIYRAPKEPYAFSNNKFGRFGPPKFSEVSFSVKNGEVSSLTINLE